LLNLSSKKFINRGPSITLEVNTQELLAAFLLAESYKPLRLLFLLSELPIQLCMRLSISSKSSWTPVSFALISVVEPNFQSRQNVRACAIVRRTAKRTYDYHPTYPTTKSAHHQKQL